METESEKLLPREITLPLLKAIGETWYRDFRDPRCPHDSWLERFDLLIEGNSSDETECIKTLRLNLLNAYHNGKISFTYREVKGHNIILKREKQSGRFCRRDDWLEDTAEMIGGNHLRHIIRWETDEWHVDAGEIIYHWVPNL